MMKSLLFWLLFILITGNTVRAQIMFVKFDRLNGLTTNQQFAGWSNIQSFSHRIETPNTATPNTPLSPEAFNNRPGMVTITMNPDIISPYLRDAAASGMPFRTVSLAWRPITNSLEEIRLNLTNVVVQSVNVSLAENNIGTEVIVLTYTEFSYDYNLILPRATTAQKYQSDKFKEIDFRKK